MLDESVLIEGCLDKQKESWDIFVQKYSKVIYWAIRKRLSSSSFHFNQDDLGEIFQDVFVSILEQDKLKQIKEAKKISGWLAIVAFNKAVDFMRRKIRKEQKVVLNVLPLKENKIRDNLHKRDLFDLLQAVIDNLADKEKLIISLNLLQGRTHKEISLIVDIPVNTVSTVIARAKAKIREALDKKGINNL